MIIDTGILVGAANPGDIRHASALKVLNTREPRIVPEPVVTEADHLIMKSAGVDAEIAFVDSLAEGLLVIECPTPADRARAGELVRRYRDLKIGYVDAVIVAIAERLRETMIATFDRRHFTVITPRHVPSFELVPDMST